MSARPTQSLLLPLSRLSCFALPCCPGPASLYDHLSHRVSLNPHALLRIMLYLLHLFLAPFSSLSHLSHFLLRVSTGCAVKYEANGTIKEPPGCNAVTRVQKVRSFYIVYYYDFWGFLSIFLSRYDNLSPSDAQWIRYFTVRTKFLSIIIVCV